MLDLSLKFTAHSLKHATYFVKNIWRTISLILKSFKNSINMQLEACLIIVHSKEVRPVHLRTRSGKKMHCDVGFFFLAIKISVQIAVGQRRRVLNSFKTFKWIMKLNLNGYTIWIGLTRIKKCMQKLAYFEIVFFYNV